MTAPTSSPFRQRMGVAALVVGGGVLLSRVLGLVREQVAAAILGGTATGDVYQAAFTIADWINYLLAGGFMAITFIPIFSRYLADDDEDGGWTAFIAVAKPVAIAMTVLVAAGFVAARPILDIVYPRFEGAQLEEAVRLTRIVLPAQVFFIVGSLLMAVQYAKGEFVVPTLAPIVYNLGIITGGIVYNVGREDPSPEGFAWGVLLGAVVGNFTIQVFGARRVGMRIPWSTPWRHPAVREYMILAVPLMVGQSIVVLDEQFMKSFGNLVSDGAVVQLQVARRTMFVPVGVVAQAAGVAAYPFLARLFAEGRHREVAATLAKALKYVVSLSIAAAGLLAALTFPTIRALFERGNFLPEHTTASASALFFYALAIPIWGVLQLVTRGFYARREMWVPVVAGSAATVVAFPIYWVLQDAFEIRGVALASTLALLIYTVTLAVIWYRRTGVHFLWPVLDTAARALPLAVIAGAGAWGTSQLVDRVLPLTGFAGSVVAIIAATAAFAAITIVAGSALGSLPGPGTSTSSPPDPDPGEPDPLPDAGEVETEASARLDAEADASAEDAVEPDPVAPSPEHQAPDAAGGQEDSLQAAPVSPEATSATPTPAAPTPNTDSLDDDKLDHDPLDHDPFDHDSFDQSGELSVWDDDEFRSALDSPDAVAEE